MKLSPILRSQTDRVLSLRRLGVALLLAVASAAIGQTAAPVGVTKLAEYDCSGLEGVALTNCRQLNAAAVNGAMVRSAGSPNDCEGMSGAPLATCLELNGQIATPAGGDRAVPNSGGSMTNASGTYTTDPTVVRSMPGNAIAPARDVTTPISQQMTGGTN